MQEPPFSSQHHAAEALSAFFVGLLYFLAQGMWQMTNSKQGAGLPVAYVLFIATAVTGAFSRHALLLYGNYPPARMRVVNACLFLPFGLVGIFSYERARLLLVAEGNPILGSAFYANQWFVIMAGFLIGTLPCGISALMSRRAEQTAAGSRTI